MVLSPSSGRKVVLSQDADAPNRVDLEFSARMHHAQVHQHGHRGDDSGASMSRLERENSQLRKEVAKLEDKMDSRSGGSRKQARSHENAALQGLSSRMQWAKEELRELNGNGESRRARGPRSIKTVKLSGAADESVWPGSEPWVRTEHNGDQTKSLGTPDGDVNPLA